MTFNIEIQNHKMLQFTGYILQPTNSKREYHNIPNISPGLIEVHKNFLVGLYSGGLIYGGLIFRRTFKLIGDLYMPNKSEFGA